MNQFKITNSFKTVEKNVFPIRYMESFFLKRTQLFKNSLGARPSTTIAEWTDSPLSPSRAHARIPPPHLTTSALAFYRNQPTRLCQLTNTAEKNRRGKLLAARAMTVCFRSAASIPPSSPIDTAIRPMEGDQQRGASAMGVTPDCL